MLPQSSIEHQRRLPVRLVYHESCPDKSSALKRELAIKALPRAQKSLLLQSQGKNL